MNHVEKLKRLLASENLSNVEMGLQLASGLAADNPQKMQQLIGRAMVPNIPYAAHHKHPVLWRGWKRWFKGNLTMNAAKSETLEPHYQYICLWLLGWQKEPIKQLHLSGKLATFPRNIKQLRHLEEIVITDRSCSPNPANLLSVPNLKRMTLWEDGSLYRFVQQKLPDVQLTPYKGY